MAYLPSSTGRSQLHIFSQLKLQDLLKLRKWLLLMGAKIMCPFRELRKVIVAYFDIKSLVPLVSVDGIGHTRSSKGSTTQKHRKVSNKQWPKSRPLGHCPKGNMSALDSALKSPSGHPEQVSISVILSLLLYWLLPGWWGIGNISI